MSVLEATSGLKREIDALAQVDPMAFDDGETVVALHRQLERLKAITARITAAFDASQAWEDDGVRSSANWVATQCRMPAVTARRELRLGRQLREMALVEQAWLAGDIGDPQVVLLAGGQRRARDEFDQAEQMLVGEAARLPYPHFARLMAYWVQCADPGGSEADAANQRDARRLHLSQSFRGMWFLDGGFDPISGEIVSKVLKDIEDELFEGDWADAKGRLGEGVSAADLCRTPAQRRADAMVEMARRAAAVPAGSRMPAPLLTVLVGYETFAGRICELASRTVVSPGSLLPWLDEAYVERVVFEGPDRVINVGQRQRLFSGATRRAVLVRDRECFHPYCDVPAEGCEVDHVEPYAAGGLTVESNGRAACPAHNRHRGRGP